MEGKALGKGLSALIPEKEKSGQAENIAYVKTQLVQDSSIQPRVDYNQEKLADLVASIKERGVLQPILVRKKDDRFEVIAGERRLKAARTIGLEEIPVIIKSVTDREALVIALIENIQREELNAIEEAHAYQKLINDFEYTQDTVAQSVGKNRTTITNLLRLLRLPAEIQQSLIENTITAGHARTLVGIENPQKQKKLFEQTLKKSLSVRDLERLSKGESAGAKRIQQSSQKDHYIIAAEEDLQRTLGTKVRIDSKKNKGKIVIDYYSNLDLERIIEVIKK